jgi:SAM-dependent methyltransferase
LRAAGRTVLGVEPDPRMAGFARGTGIEVEVATFEAWEPAGRTFDAVVSGTAWHWIDPVAGPTKAAQVLRPGGVLAPFGHVYQLPPTVAEALAAAYRRVAPDSPINLDGRPDGSVLDAYHALYAKAVDRIPRRAGSASPSCGATTGNAHTPPTKCSTCCRPRAGSPACHRTEWRKYWRP